MVLDGGTAASRDKSRLGRYRFDVGRPVGTPLHVRAVPTPDRTPTCVPTEATAATGDGDAPPALTLRLDVGIEIDVDVRLPDGSPLGERVSPQVSLIGPLVANRAGDGSRGGTGPFRFRVQPGATCTLRVEAPGFATFRQRGWVVPRSSQAVVVTMGAGAEVRGVIEGCSGALAGGMATVECFAVEPGPRPAGHGVASVAYSPNDTDGRFSIRGLAPGRYRLYGRRSRGDEEYVTTLELARDAVVDLGVIALTRPSSVVVRVSDERGAPLGGAWCAPYVAGLPRGGFGSRHDGRATLRIPENVAGLILVTKPGYGTQVVECPAGPRGELAVVLPDPGSVRLRVDGRASRGWSSHVAAADGRLVWQQRNTDYSSQAAGDESIEYRIPDLSPGPIRVGFRGDDRDVYRIVEVIAGQTVEVRITLE